mmetsp:Transcript_9485/g.13126  ORF Transcript_9485/g.13126 Transcript_9485/m.13126 type:complete len:86 (+) Transcript_9485:188-445(+)
MTRFLYCFLFPLSLRHLLQRSWDCRKNRSVVVILSLLAGLGLVFNVQSSPSSPNRRLAYGAICLLLLGLWLPMLRDGKLKKKKSV